MKIVFVVLIALIAFILGVLIVFLAQKKWYSDKCILTKDILRVIFAECGKKRSEKDLNAMILKYKKMQGKKKPFAQKM
jgi:uncharacterized protein YneF (UPF0154 family)